MYIGLYKTPNKALSCLVLLPLVPFVTPCHPCYPLLPLLPLVTLATLCYPLLPLLPFVSPCYPCYPCYPLLPLLHRRTTEEFHMTLKMFSSNRGRRVRRFNTYLSPPILSMVALHLPYFPLFLLM